MKSISCLMTGIAVGKALTLSQNGLTISSKAVARKATTQLLSKSETVINSLSSVVTKYFSNLVVVSLTANQALSFKLKNYE